MPDTAVCLSVEAEQKAGTLVRHSVVDGVRERGSDIIPVHVTNVNRDSPWLTVRLLKPSTLPDLTKPFFKGAVLVK